MAKIEKTEDIKHGETEAHTMQVGALYVGHLFGIIYKKYLMS